MKAFQLTCSLIRSILSFFELSSHMVSLVLGEESHGAVIQDTAPYALFLTFIASNLYASYKTEILLLIFLLLIYMLV